MVPESKNHIYQTPKPFWGPENGVKSCLGVGAAGTISQNDFRGRKMCFGLWCGARTASTRDQHQHEAPSKCGRVPPRMF